MDETAKTLAERIGELKDDILDTVESGKRWAWYDWKNDSFVVCERYEDTTRSRVVGAGLTAEQAAELMK
jgi:hypothetical protein